MTIEIEGSMGEIVAYREGLLSALEGVVNELAKIAAGIPSKAWYQPLSNGSHTPHYILAHLRALESLLFLNQLTRILDEETPVLQIFDDETWMATHYKPEEPTLSIMEDIVNLRKQELNWLRKLPSATWSRTARHPWWGVHTLQWWVELQLDYSHNYLRELYPLLDV
jgi:hypothetical protein